MINKVKTRQNKRIEAIISYKINIQFSTILRREKERKSY